jgi:hypothetical protein
MMEHIMNSKHAVPANYGEFVKLHYEFVHKARQLMEREITQADNNSAAYGQLALKSAFMLNGGALIAFPAYVQFWNTLPKEFVGLSVVLFVAGLVLAALAAFLAYANWGFGSDKYGLIRAQGEAGAAQAARASFSLVPDPKETEENSKREKQIRVCHVKIVISLWATSISGVLSYAAFAAGVVQLMWRSNLI